MSTKTMRLPPRRVSTSNKRKEGEGSDALESPAPAKLFKPASPRACPDKPLASNQILAGYLAHEYLAKGTLFGQPWDPARGDSAETSKKPRQESEAEAEAEAEAEPRGKAGYKRYVDVSSLLKIEGAHLPDVINPTQLAGLLNM